MRYTLRLQQQDIDLAEGDFLIGRAVTCQLSLDDPMVSRNHARLRITETAVVLEDLGSRNGVKVNGERVDRQRSLVHGDQLVIGSHELVLLARRDLAADTLVQTPEIDRAGFGLMGALADKALALGRGDEAERLIGQQLDQALSDAESGRSIEPENVERATAYALRIAAATQSSRWIDFLFRFYTVLKRPCPAPMVDELYTIVRKVQRPSPGALRTYLAVLRTLELGPADRFLVSRLEGLERLIGAR